MKTKIEQLEQTINKAQKELQELKAESVKKINYWQPEGGEYYWYVGMEGIACRLTKMSPTKRYRVFKTEQETEKYAEYVKAEETLREAIAIANKGWLPDFSEETDKFYVLLQGNKIDFNWVANIKSQPSFMYIKSQELAEQLMEDYEAEYLTYLSY